MKYRLFGSRTGLYVSELVLGASMIGNRKGYGSTKEEGTAIVNRYFEAGGNFIDLADQYQLGETEEIIGGIVADRRKDVLLVSKYTRTDLVSPGRTAMGNHRKAMIQSVEASLRRLKTDYLDIYLAHFDDGVTPVEEMMRGLDDLARSGKILYGGFANFPAWKVAAAASVANATISNPLPVSAIQIEYNLLQRESEREILPMAESFGLGVMMYSPLAGGKLTGKYREGAAGRMTVMGLAGPEDVKTAAVLDALQQISAENGATPGQLALAWVKSKNHFPILGARTIQQLNDNLKAAELVLTIEQLRWLDEVSAIPLGYPHEINAGQQRLMRDK